MTVQAKPLPPHAPCRLQRFRPKILHCDIALCLHTLRADCNAHSIRDLIAYDWLCLHTLRADCNACGALLCAVRDTLPPHAPCRLQPSGSTRRTSEFSFASTRSVQIATSVSKRKRYPSVFASTRSVQIATAFVIPLTTPQAFASTRSVQIATVTMRQCYPCRWTLPPHAPCRLQRQKCTELQYALFRTCVELVDSFSVLNKAMLR